MARYAIVGAHGLVAQQLMHLLYDRFDEFVGIVRNPDHAEDIYRLGGEGVVLDIEHADEAQLAEAFAGVHAVIFSAGAGAGSGTARKRTVDYEGSVKSATAARMAGVHRFVQVSAWHVDEPVADDADEVWAAYVAAKRDADAALRRSGLDWTILRPGGLTSEPASGRIALAPRLERGTIPREDVAAVIVACLSEPATIGRQWELVKGETPIADAVARQTRAASA